MKVRSIKILTSWVTAFDNKDLFAWAALLTGLLGDQITANHLLSQSFGIIGGVDDLDTALETFYRLIFEVLSC